MMEVEAPHAQFDWANDAFMALDNTSPKWAALQNQTPSFSIPPSLLTQATIERFGQVTPPEERSPADLAHDAREASIPVEQLRNEAPWLHHDNDQQSSSPHDATEPSPKRRRTSRQSADNSSSSPQDPNPQPPKRKRGRPKSQPQMVEAFTSDGYPFQVSSARQSHLEKNRVAAHKCRQRKKEYITSLEGRAREYSSKNKALKENVAMLREEVLSLKTEVLRHAGCGFWAVDEYLARCAGDLLGIEAPRTVNQDSRVMNKNPRPSSTESMLSQPIDISSPELEDDLGGLELLRDFDDDDLDDLDNHQ